MRSKTLIAATLLLTAVVSFSGSPQVVPADTLGELLTANGIRNVQSVPRSVREKYIGGGNNWTRNGSDFVFAGYLFSSLPVGLQNNPVDDKLHVVWAGSLGVQYRAVPVTVTGSVSSITFARDRAYISLHVSPSGSNTVVLTRDLKLEKELWGWPIKFLASGTVVYHNSQIHFAPTHPAAISAYDPVRRMERKIYPPASPDPVRTDFVNRVKAAYARRGEEWFRVNNHHMEAASFDSYFGVLEADEKEQGVIAFTIRYDNPINDGADPRAAWEDVVTTCTSMNRV